MVKSTGRGETANAASNRFNQPERQADGDWLDHRQYIDGLQPKPSPTVGILKSKTIITRNTSPDIPFNQSINGYVSYEHSYGVVHEHCAPCCRLTNWNVAVITLP